MKRTLTIGMNVLLTAALIAVAALFAAASLPIPGKVEVRIVRSGSMEPTILTGGIVVTQPSTHYASGDIITFADADAEIPTTHRIIDVREEGGTTYFTTKGDANEERDANEVAESDVLGRVLFSLPYAGYIIDFTRQPLGFILLVVVPAGLVVLHELFGIFDQVVKGRRKKSSSPEHSSEVLPRNAEQVPQGTGVRIIYTRSSAMEDIYRPEHLPEPASPSARSRAPFIALAFLAPLGAMLFGGTLAGFSDAEHSKESFLAAAGLDFGVDADLPRSIALTVDGYGEDHAAVIVPYIEDYVGAEGLAYSIRAEQTGGDSAFCNALSLEGTEPVFEYYGPLLSLSTGTTSDPSPWSLRIEVPESSPEIPDGTTCLVDLVYESDGEGYSDEERLSLFITYRAPAAPAALLLSAPPEETTPEVLSTEEPETAGESGEASLPTEPESSAPEPEEPLVDAPPAVPLP